MHLDHSFSEKTRYLFFDFQYCWKCGVNANAMLEIHHICGRKKHENYLDSPFNASVLCKKCHDSVTHSGAERRKLFEHTLKILKYQAYIPTNEDIYFIREHAEDKFHVKPELMYSFILSGIWDKTIQWT